MNNNNPVDAIVLGGIDQFLPHGSTEKSILKSVHSKVEEAIEAQDIVSLGRIGQALLGVGQVSGVAFAQYVYTVEACWSKLNQRDSFFDWAEDKLGKNKTTVERYHRVHAMFVSGDIDKEFVDKFKTMGVGSLFAIANMWHQGWEVTDSQWRKLADAPDPSTVRKIIREIKKKPEKAGTLNIEWHKDQRAIVGWENGKPYTIYLTYESSPTIDKMLNRILGDGKALEK